jgi:hypothetical protein
MLPEASMTNTGTTLLDRIRQNHALEHATVHVLSQRRPRPRVLARSNWDGFTIYGPLETDTVVETVTEALHRLKRGESHLAIHPNCGTNLVVGGLFAGAASSLTLMGKSRSPFRRLVAFAVAALAGFALAHPLGPVFQEHLTTSSDLAGVTIREIVREQRGRFMTHRIRTRLE